MNNPALPNRLDSRAFRLLGRAGGHEKFFAENPAQPIDKSRFGRENPRKSKLFQPPKAGVFAAKWGGAKKTQDDRRHANRDDTNINITFIDSARVREGAGPCRDPLAAAAAAPGVVLRVADRIVRIGLLIVTGEDLRGPRRRGTDLLIGVAARERERRDRDDDRAPVRAPGRTIVGSARGRGKPSGCPFLRGQFGQPVGVFRRTSPNKIGFRRRIGRGRRTGGVAGRRGRLFRRSWRIMPFLRSAALGTLLPSPRLAAAHFRKDHFHAARKRLLGLRQTDNRRERQMLMVRATEEAVLGPPCGDIEGRMALHDRVPGEARARPAAVAGARLGASGHRIHWRNTRKKPAHSELHAGPETQKPRQPIPVQGKLAMAAPIRRRADCPPKICRSFDRRQPHRRSSVPR